MNQLWFYERHTSGYGVHWKINKVLHAEKTQYQELAIIDTVECGKTLVLDGNIQVSEMDEFIYHEMIAHTAMNSHPHPEKILIIGGGDGGTAREVLKHDTVLQVDLVEIDHRVIENSRIYLPSMACSFDDPRLNLHIEDGIQFVRDAKECYDMVIIDSSDPIGPAVQLYGREFYLNVYNKLNDDGMIVVQSESPVFYQDIFVNVFQNLSSVFDKVKVCLAPIMTYTSGPWSFTVGSKKWDPERIAGDKKQINGLKYYNEHVHKGAFILPQFIKEMLR
ncbi:spermidine synthase [hydrocarbon metagenome]|uniref:Spermidine synthase n=1 Tax=hydrocarbon metagenome TaxID=938273 RepID=A0A0W8E447_9ZZZZ